MDISRRHLLGTVALGGVAASAVGCAELQSIETSLPPAVADLQNLAASLVGQEPNLATAISGGASIITSVQSGIASFSNSASAVEAAVKAGANDVKAVVTDAVNAFTNIKSAVTNPSTGAITTAATGAGSLFSSLLQAGITFMPEILSLAGVALAAPMALQPSMRLTDARKLVAAMAK